MINHKYLLLINVALFSGWYGLKLCRMQKQDIVRQFEVLCKQQLVPCKASAALPAPSNFSIKAIICDDNTWAVWINDHKWTNANPPHDPYTIKKVTPSQVTLNVNGQDLALRCTS